MFPLSIVIVLLFDSDLQDNELRSWPVEVFQLANLTSLSGTSRYFAFTYSHKRSLVGCLATILLPARTCRMSTSRNSNG